MRGIYPKVPIQKASLFYVDKHCEKCHNMSMEIVKKGTKSMSLASMRPVSKSGFLLGALLAAAAAAVKIAVLDTMDRRAGRPIS
jgi:hypothetical protein